MTSGTDSSGGDATSLYQVSLDITDEIFEAGYDMGFKVRSSVNYNGSTSVNSNVTLFDGATELDGYHACTEMMQPKTIFSIYMILMATLFTMGVSREANQIMARTQAFVDCKANFLRPNFKAYQTE